MKRKKFLIFAASVLISFVAGGCALAANNVNEVDLGEGYKVPLNFSSVLIESSDGTAIQNAVENIASGGTILLSGDFKLKKSINIKKNLKIIGSNNTILTGPQAGSAPEADRVIRCQGDITLQNLIITGGSSTNGGGVKLDGGKVEIISCDIKNNKSTLGGGGIHSTASTLILTSCDITDNYVMLAGGGMSMLGGEATINNCNISGNKTDLYGGGLGAAGSKITINNSTITNNSAGKYGGGITLTLQSSATATNCNITANTASQSEDICVVDSSYEEK